MTRSVPLRPRRTAGMLLAAALLAITLLSSSAKASGVQVLHLSAMPNMVMRFNVSHLRAHRGRIELVMRNPTSAGISHGIAVEGHGVRKIGPTVGPGHTAVLTLTLTRKGNYTFFCPVPGHRQAGMAGTLTIS